MVQLVLTILIYLIIVIPVGRYFSYKPSMKLRSDEAASVEHIKVIIAVLWCKTKSLYDPLQ